MTILDGCFSLKLECALRDLGFIEMDWRVIASAGVYFIIPVGDHPLCRAEDDLLGFQIRKTNLSLDPLADCRTVLTAKRALDLAIDLS